MSRFDFSGYRRLVIKVGSSLLVDGDGELNRSWLKSLADDLAVLAADGHELLVVSSGSIAIGRSNIKSRAAGLIHCLK